MSERYRVDLGKRTFFVTFKDGRPHSIRVRKVYAAGQPYEALYDAPYWHHSRPVGNPKTIVSRILSEVSKRRSRSNVATKTPDPTGVGKSEVTENKE